MLELSENIATFEVSGISVPLPKGWYFHDEGASKLDLFVPLSEGSQTILGRMFDIVMRHLTRYNLEVKRMDLKEAEQEARETALEKMGFRTKFLDSIQGSFELNGAFLKYGPTDFGKGEETHLHLIYLDLEREDVNLMVQAHEEQHALNQIPGGIDTLEKKIAEDRGTPIHFNHIRDKELAADCNGVYALTKRGLDLGGVNRYITKQDSRCGKRFNRARYIYETGDYGYWRFLGRQMSSVLKSVLRKETS